MLKISAISSVAGAVYTVLSSINFSNTITTGSIIGAVVVVIIAGLFTVRTNVARTWREYGEGEHAHRLALEKELSENRANILAEREEQQRIRHDLKNEIAALRVKTDLTVHEATESKRHEEVAQTLSGIKDTMSEMSITMRQIASQLNRSNEEES